MDTDDLRTFLEVADAGGVFARVYEVTANRNTGQIAAVALDRIGDVRWGTRVLDIAAGTEAIENVFV